MEVLGGREVKSLWKMREIECHCLPVKGVEVCIVVIWRADGITCREVIREG